MGVSKNGGTQQPWVFLLKMIILGCFGGTTLYGNTHICISSAGSFNLSCFRHQALGPPLAKYVQTIGIQNCWSQCAYIKWPNILFFTVLKHLILSFYSMVSNKTKESRKRWGFPAVVMETQDPITMVHQVLGENGHSARLARHKSDGYYRPKAYNLMNGWKSPAATDINQQQML